MRFGLKNSVLGNAKVMQKQFLNDFAMVIARNTYRAPGRYHMTNEQFATEVEKTDLNLKHYVMIAFMCQAFVEQSKWRTRRMNHIIRWVEKVSQLQEAAEQARILEAAKLKALGHGGIGTVIDFPTLETPVPLNRKQRRLLERKGIPTKESLPASGATHPSAPEDGGGNLPRAD